jgi:YD repeat-containing protein
LISSRDATQLFTIDGKGLHSRTQSTLNGAEIYRFNYDDKGYLTQIIDSNGLITKIERDSQENVSAIVAPKGQRTTFMLDGNGYLATVTNPASETFKMQYDNKGLLTSLVKPNGVTSFISYDATGNLVDDKIAGVGWSFSRVNLDSNSYYVTKSSGMGLTTRYQVEHLPNGDILRTNTFSDGTKNTELRKANGQTSETNVNGTVAVSINASDPRFGTQSEYLAAKTISTPGGLQYQFSQTRQINLKNPKDILSVVSQVQTATTNGKTLTASFTTAQNRWSITSAAGRSQDVYVDIVGKPLKVQQAGLESINYSYDAEGRVVKITQGTRSTGYTYDGQGNVATETNSVGKTTAYEYDLAGRVVKQNYPNGQSVSFAYDASGNLTGVTPPSRPTHLFQYNGIDDLQNYNPPSVASGGGTQYQYNLDRQITQIQRPDGLIVSLNYNSFGRLERLVTPDGNTAFFVLECWATDSADQARWIANHLCL